MTTPGRHGLLASAIAIIVVPSASAPATAAEVERPSIVSMKSGVYENEAVMEAEVDPGGLATKYEIQACTAIVTCQRSEGELPAGTNALPVRISVDDPLRGASYSFILIARNVAGEATQMNELKIPSEPPGSCPDGCGTAGQYESEVPAWYIKLSETESAETREEYEARHEKELEAEHVREREEQQARELIARKLQEEQGVLDSVSLVSTRLVVIDKRVSRVALRCAGTAKCSGMLILRSSITHTAESRRGQAMTIGSRSFSIVGADQAVVGIKLNPRGRSLLRAAHGHLDARLTIDETSPKPGDIRIETVSLVGGR